MTEPSLPPKPWDWVASGTASHNGQFHAYLVDATGRKIAAIWGKPGEKELIADHILRLVNETDDCTANLLEAATAKEEGQS